MLDFHNALPQPPKPSQPVVALPTVASAATAAPAAPAPTPGPNWLERLWSSLSLPSGGARLSRPTQSSVDRCQRLAEALLSERGEASGAAIAHELLISLRALTGQDRLAFYRFLAGNFQPDVKRLRAAAEAYVAAQTAETAARLGRASEPPRQEVLRRINQTPEGTAALVGLRKELLGRLREEPALKPLDEDLKHLFSSWFNRGFLELRRIDWQSPAAVLEKLIAYEAVHEIQGWDDLRRRLAPDRRCFGFFHPALPGEPLIFVEVALVDGLATSVQRLLERTGDDDPSAAHERAAQADTAIFYSISNCQDGLRGISFGNFLIKQVVEELKVELPRLRRFSTLSPVPGLRRWLDKRIASGLEPQADTLLALKIDKWWEDPVAADMLREPMMRACAAYLTQASGPKGAADPVARFHLGNGARLERINWLGNFAPRGIAESYGLMVNYLYDPDLIEANHEAFAHDGTVARSAEVDELLGIKSTRPALGRVGRLGQQTSRMTRRLFRQA